MYVCAQKRDRGVQARRKAGVKRVEGKSGLCNGRGTLRRKAALGEETGVGRLLQGACAGDSGAEQLAAAKPKRVEVEPAGWQVALRLPSVDRCDRESLERISSIRLTARGVRTSV